MVGLPVGVNEGLLVVGDRVGCDVVGDIVGRVVGDLVGDVLVGLLVGGVGFLVGEPVGANVGESVGTVGDAVVGRGVQASKRTAFSSYLVEIRQATLEVHWALTLSANSRCISSGAFLQTPMSFPARHSPVPPSRSPGLSVGVAIVC